MAGRRRKAATPTPTPEMASGVLNTPGSANSANKHIPLFCRVCPDTPRFSDVSHLLTHIASKGHLHHETQTKLKAHQDPASSLALHQYEQWYREYNIEALLVERMKAKQIKEAAKGKRARGLSSASMAKPKRKLKRGAEAIAIKSEQDELVSDFPLFPELYQSDDEADVFDDYFAGGDMLSLKGQVWPGMGKMDLANEEMKRTRNQRKPKSVIDKMRRTSEGIKPTQVVMTPDFQVEREKGVYDPPSGEEDSSPPRRVTKRKKQDILRDVAVNVPKQGTKSNGRGGIPAKRPRVKGGSHHEARSGVVASAAAPFRNQNDVFRDDDGSSGTGSPFDLVHLNRGFNNAQTSLFDNRSFSSTAQHDQRFDLRSRMIPSLNPISSPQIVSPTPNARDASNRMFSERHNNRGQTQAQPLFGPFQNIEPPYSMHDILNSRTPFQTGGYVNGNAHESFRFSPNSLLQTKQEDFTGSTGVDSVPGSASGQFLNVSGTNPLFSTERMLLNSFSQPMPSATLPSLAFTPINRSREHEQPGFLDGHHSSFHDGSIRPDHQHDGSNDSQNSNESGLNSNNIWNPHATSDDLDLQDSLESDGLQI